MTEASSELWIVSRIYLLFFFSLSPLFLLVCRLSRGAQSETSDCLLPANLVVLAKRKKKIKNDQQSLTRENLTDKHPNLASTSLKKDKKSESPPQSSAEIGKYVSVGILTALLGWRKKKNGPCSYLACNEEPQSEDASLA